MRLSASGYDRNDVPVGLLSRRYTVSRFDQFRLPNLRSSNLASTNGTLCDDNPDHVSTDEVERDQQPRARPVSLAACLTARPLLIILFGVADTVRYLKKSCVVGATAPTTQPRTSSRLFHSGV
jgi:hypothetical protein